MSEDRVEKALEMVAREIGDAWIRNAPNTLGVLEARLGPLLRAGQAMRDDERSRAENTLKANKPLKRTTAATLWDAALEELLKNG